MHCSKCSEELPTDGDFVTCFGCKSELHFQCSGIKKNTYLAKGKENKVKWRCVSCREDSRKSDSNTPTDATKTFSIDDSVMFKTLIEELKSDILSEIREVLKKGFMEAKEEIIAEFKSLSETVEKLKKDCAEKDRKIEDLYNQVNNLDQYSRNKNFEIENLENVNGECVEEIVLNLAAKLEIDLKADEIDAAHRLPTRANSNRPPRIIVQLTSRKKRDIFINKKNQIAVLTNQDVIGGNNKNRIYVNENLTAFNRDLLWRAKGRAQETGYKFVWYKFGKILVRKNENSREVLKIFSYTDLDKIKAADN